ncbi:MAG TPA: S8 family serine peptidase [Acidimicrobiales bacterium]|nr:S8 family serine peptidase [Acidimicrobiales bacterium]
MTVALAVALAAVPVAASGTAAAPAGAAVTTRAPITAPALVNAAAAGAPVAATVEQRLLIGWSAATPPPLVAGARLVAVLPHIGIAVLAATDVAAAVAAYRDVPGVAWAERDATVTAAAAPDDPLFADQWALQTGPNSIDWEPAFPSQQGAGALVAVLDTGFQPGGPDAPADLRLDLAKSFVPGTSSSTDDNGHGTFVTDIIGEATDNAIGAAGIAPAAAIVPVKVLGANGTGDLSVVAQGVDYAVSIGAKVINLSLAGDLSFALCAAVARAAPAAVVVAASGNDSSDASVQQLDYPAACPGALAVGSIGFDGSRPPYANVGCTMAVVAPGGDDLALYHPGMPASDWLVQQGYDANPFDGQVSRTFQYMREEGTSMSAAEVSGEAALLVGMGADAATARRLIIGTARSRGGFLTAYVFGAGVVDVAAAVTAYASRAAVAPHDRGYQLAALDGRAVTAGDACAGTETSRPAVAPSQPIVGEAATPDGFGSWLVARDGGIFTFGDAAFLGSSGALRLNQPIVGMAGTPSGHGYWLVARDGGIFSFGDAAFFGSTGALRLNQPIMGMAATPSGRGYWLVAADGGIFTFGDAAFHGSTAAAQLTQPIVGIATTSSGQGYWLAGGDGSVFGFGDAVVYASAAGSGPVAAIVGETRGKL